MARVSGKIVKIGDYVNFKNDVEQYGRIILIVNNTLTLSGDDEFEGENIGGDKETTVDASECWLDGVDLLP
jgi:hypothetical protein